MTPEQRIMHSAWWQLGVALDCILSDPALAEEIITEVRGILYVAGPHHNFSFPVGTPISEMLKEIADRHKGK